jgi:hypothetical protein
MSKTPDKPGDTTPEKTPVDVGNDSGGEVANAYHVPPAKPQK